VSVLPAIVALSFLVDVLVFCCHETVTDPGPLPEDGETVSQDPLPLAVQPPPWQPEGEPVRLTSNDPGEALALVDVGEMVKLEHVTGELPLWSTVNVFPAIVARSLLVEVPLFCCQERVTDPGPLPLEGETVNHEPLPLAVQLPPWQPLGNPLIVTDREPAPAAGFVEVGEIVKLEHVGGELPL